MSAGYSLHHPGLEAAFHTKGAPYGIQSHDCDSRERLTVEESTEQ
jgi:hypothetical protein